MKTLSLNGKWNGSRLDALGNATMEFESTVPGCVHTDLMANGTIKDLYWRDNDEQYLWIEKSNWCFARTFWVADYTSQTYLQFEGLDCYAEIYLNDRFLAKTDDAHISYRFPAAKLLQCGENKIEVFFRSAVRDITKQRPAAFTNERVFTRRIQCTYSWDWVARFVTCGITGNVTLVTPETAELNSWYLYTESIDAYSAQLKLSLNFDLFNQEDFERFVVWELRTPGNQVLRRHRQRIVENMQIQRIDIAQPELWYPNGYGAQPLYEIRIAIEQNGETKEVACERFGIRTLKLLQLPDAENSEYRKICRDIQATGKVSENGHCDRNEETSGFIVLVNGEKVFCRGGNWVPCEPFPSAEADEKQTEILELSHDAGVNMLRVWGGGVFEKEHFYRECTRLGILVTQDFLMACGTYPEDEAWFIGHLKWETEFAVRKLRNFTCLAWWTGDNENAVNGDENQVSYTGRRSAMEGIAPILEQYDPVRPFLPSSPYGGYPYGSVTVGTAHNTLFVGDYFHDILSRDMSDYREYQKKYRARFSVEEPVFGTSELVNIRRIMTDEDIFDKNEMWYYHSRTNPGFKEAEIFECMRTYAAKVFGEFTSPQDMVRKTQYLQYEWVRVSMELFRRNKWFSAGMVYWMLADCWPSAAGWSMIDYYCLPKSGYFAFKRAAKPVIASIDCDSGFYMVTVCNDTYATAKGTAEVYVCDFDGGKRSFEIVKPFEAAANTSEVIVKVPKAEMERYLTAKSVLICDITGEGFSDRAQYLLYSPAKTELPTPRVSIVRRDESSVTVRAESYVHAVHLEGCAVVEDNYFTMLAGEERTIKVRPVKDMPQELLTVSAAIG